MQGCTIKGTSRGEAVQAGTDFASTFFEDASHLHNHIFSLRTRHSASSHPHGYSDIRALPVASSQQRMQGGRIQWSKFTFRTSFPVPTPQLKMKSWKLIALALSASLTCSCTFNAQLTPTSGPLARQGVAVLPASFTYTGSGSGKITVTMPDGEVCTGRYFTAVEGSSTSSFGNSSGNFYGQGSSNYSGTYGGSPYYGSSNSTLSGYSNTNYSGYSNSSSNIGYGKAVATGSKGTVITINYQTSRSSPTHGQGNGQDNRGNFYTMVF